MKTLIALIASLGLGAFGMFGSDSSADALTPTPTPGNAGVSCTAEPTEDGRCRITCINDAGETCSVIVDCDAIEDCQDVNPADGCTPGVCPR